MRAAAVGDPIPGRTATRNRNRPFVGGAAQEAAVAVRGQEPEELHRRDRAA
jgi:hypothetical protein